MISYDNNSDNNDDVMMLIWYLCDDLDEYDEMKMVMW